MRNSQQARKTGPDEVKLEGKRRTHTMPDHASGTRPGPENHGAPTPPPLSRNHVNISWLEAVLFDPEGGQP